MMLYWIRIVVFEDGLIVCGNEPYITFQIIINHKPNLVLKTNNPLQLVITHSHHRHEININ